jgi:glucosamine kinase
MILVADSGSTKTDWAMIYPPQHLPSGIVSTIGFNPYFIDSEGIIAELESTLLPNIPNNEIVEAVYFYGAGSSSADKQAIVYHALKSVFPLANTIEVAHDLLGSARALLGRQSGFAAILGTGTNTCIYDGKDCVYNVDSLGYLLGDEGSGSYIGKKILAAYMRGLLDLDLNTDFENMFGKMATSQRISELYKNQFPNRVLASFAQFAGKHNLHPIIKNIIHSSFVDFFDAIVVHYPNYNHYTFNCVGSIAKHFEHELRAVAQQYNMQVGLIISAPIEQLAAFHAKGKSDIESH